MCPQAQSWADSFVFLVDYDEARGLLPPRDTLECGELSVVRMLYN